MRKKRWDRFVEAVFVDGLLAVADVVEKNKGMVGVATQSFMHTAPTVGREAMKQGLVSCAKSGVTGAILDSTFSIREAKRYYENDLIDKKTALKHIAKEAGCGLTSSSLGTAASTVASSIFKASPSTTLLVGIGSAVGARYLYRNVVPSSLPQQHSAEDKSNNCDTFLHKVNSEILIREKIINMLNLARYRDDHDEDE